MSTHTKTPFFLHLAKNGQSFHTGYFPNKTHQGDIIYIIYKMLTFGYVVFELHQVNGMVTKRLGSKNK